MRISDWSSDVCSSDLGCGLLRTEFLFLDRAQPPDEAEQRAAYQAIADALGPRPLIVRTLDLGADKPAPWLTLAAAANPAIGRAHDYTPVTNEHVVCRRLPEKKKRQSTSQN